jgi:hypothetical protein
MAKYNVLFKAFTSGEWYTKTDTDSKAAAFSVARIGNYGRACRLVDTETDEVLYETEEDPDCKAVNGDVSKFRY